MSSAPSERQRLLRGWGGLAGGSRQEARRESPQMTAEVEKNFVKLLSGLGLDKRRGQTGPFTCWAFVLCWDGCRGPWGGAAAGRAPVCHLREKYNRHPRSANGNAQQNKQEGARLGCGRAGEVRGHLRWGGAAGAGTLPSGAGGGQPGGWYMDCYSYTTSVADWLTVWTTAACHWLVTQHVHISGGDFAPRGRWCLGSPSAH